jgi:hypothetical protein
MAEYFNEDLVLEVPDEDFIDDCYEVRVTVDGETFLVRNVHQEDEYTVMTTVPDMPESILTVSS